MTTRLHVKHGTSSRLIQDDQSADDSTLRRSRVHLVVLPFLHIASVEEFPYQSEESPVGYPLRENRDKDIVVNVVEEAFDVSLDKPLCSRETLLDAEQCGVAAAVGSESVRGMLEASLIHGFKYHPHDLLHQLVLKAGDSEGAHLPVLFGNVRPACRLWLVGFVFQRCNDAGYSFEGHLVGGLAVRASRHVALLRIDALVGHVEHFLIEQQTIKSLELVARYIAVF